MTTFFNVEDQAAGILHIAHGGTGNDENWSRGLVIAAGDGTNGGLTVGDVVKWRRSVSNDTRVIKASGANTTDLVGVVVGYFTGQQVDEYVADDPPSGGVTVAVMIRGRCYVNISAAVTLGQYAYLGGTSGQILSSATNNAGALGLVMQTSASGQAEVWLYGSVTFSGYGPIGVSHGTGDGPLPWFNVMAYGAKGDGSTVDTAAIDAAITALTAAGRGVLYFPANAAGGDYITAGGHTLSVPCTVIGDGWSRDNDSIPVSRVTCNSATAVLFTCTSDNGLFQNIALRCSNTATAGAGIKVTGSGNLATRWDFDRVRVSRFYIDVDVQVGDNWTMRNCAIYAPVKYGLKIRNTVNGDAGDWSISDTVFYALTYNADAAIRIESSGGGKIVNCKINQAGNIDSSHNFVHGINVDSLVGNTSVLHVANSSIENYTGDAIHINIASHVYNLMTFVGLEVGQVSNTTGYAISITSDSTSNCSQVVIADCVFKSYSAASTPAIALTKVDRAILSAISQNGYTGIYSATSCTNLLDMTTQPLTNPMTTEGDLIYDASGSPARLAIGASGKVLTSNGTDPTWGNGPMTTKGDIMAGGTSGAITRLAVGSNGQIVTADSTQTLGIKWATLPVDRPVMLADTDGTHWNVLVDGDGNAIMTT